jgi:hypothetical protein
MATATVTPTAAADRRLARGAAIMAVAGVGFVGYGLLFLVQNFTGFLELASPTRRWTWARPRSRRSAPRWPTT